MNDGTLVKQIDTAMSLQGGVRRRIEVDTAPMTDIGLNIAARRGNPMSAPPEARPEQRPAAEPKRTIDSFS